MPENTAALEEHNQRQIIKDLVIQGGPLRTDQIRLAAFKKSISCADTYLRMLARNNEIARFWEVNDKGKHIHSTKSWCSPEYYNENIKPHLGARYV